MSGTASRCRAALVLIAICLAYRPAAVAQTPEQEKMWAEQRAQAQAEDRAKAERLAKEREARRAEPMVWVRTLDPLSSGGWAFRSVAGDGSWVTYSTEHQMKRSGRLVTAWLRREYAETQRTGGEDAYLSDVEKVQYDCGKERARVLLMIYYAANNLAGSQQTEEADPKQATWDPIVPGTQSEIIFHWACGVGSTGARPR